MRGCLVPDRLSDLGRALLVMIFGMLTLVRGLAVTPRALMSHSIKWHPPRLGLPLMLRDAAAQDMPVLPGDLLEVWIDTETDEGEVWAASTVSFVDSVSGEFMVMVTEWDALEKNDPRYEEAYEEGPFSAEEAGEEWRRPGAPAAPVNLRAGD